MHTNIGKRLRDELDALRKVGEARIADIEAITSSLYKTYENDQALSWVAHDMTVARDGQGVALAWPNNTPFRFIIFSDRIRSVWPDGPPRRHRHGWRSWWERPLSDDVAETEQYCVDWFRRSCLECMVL